MVNPSLQPARWTIFRTPLRAMRAARRRACSVHRGPLQMPVDFLVMVEPLDRAVERIAAAVHGLDLLFLRRDALSENFAIEVFDRIGKVREHGELAVR